MSRIGRQPVILPAGVSVSVSGRTVHAKGPKGELSWTCPEGIQPVLNEGRLEVRCERKDKAGRALHGTSRSLLANMVRGVAEGYSKTLEIHGVGFRAALQGKKLVLNLGFSHPIEYVVPEGVTLKLAENTLVVSGPDKQQVGQVAARIRAFYPPEPYKGKGIRLKGEYVRRKVGKTVA